MKTKIISENGQLFEIINHENGSIEKIHQGIDLDSLTPEEKKKREITKSLGYVVTENSKPSTLEVEMAEYIIKNEDEIEILKNEINKLKGSVVND